MFAIHLDSLPMWLATIEASRVAEHVRSKLITYQKECARVLRDHFFGRQTVDASVLAELVTEMKALREENRALKRFLAQRGAFLDTNEPVLPLDDHERFERERMGAILRELSVGLPMTFRTLGDLTLIENRQLTADIAILRARRHILYVPDYKWAITDLGRFALSKMTSLAMAS